MSKREMICIVCPMGCRLNANIEGENITISGNTCPRGDKYGRQEITAPERTVTSSVALEGGTAKLCPVKTAAPIPKAKVPQALAEIRHARAHAPVHIGDVLIADIAGTGVNVVATAMR